MRVGVADGYGSAGFFEVVQGLHPRGIPKSEARGGAGVAVTKVKKYLAKMDRAVDYDFYDDDDLRYVRFKSPFDRRPLIGRRPHPGYVVLDALRSCLLVCSARLAIKSLGIYLVLIWMVLIRGVCVVGVQEERGEAHPPPRREQQPGLHATMVRHLDLLISVLCRQSCDFSFCC